MRAPTPPPLLWLTTVIALLLTGCSSGGATSDGDSGAGSFLLGGIQVNEPDHAAWMHSLGEAGMNTVSVTVYAMQGDWDSDNLWWKDEEPWVLAEIRAAKRHGLRVVLIPRVALDDAFPRNRFLWHGMIMPRTDQQVEEWFRRYRRFVTRWGRIAAEEGVDLYAVGSEMSSLTSTALPDALPPLEEYFLNREKQAGRKKRVLPFAEQLDERHLWVRGDSTGNDDLEAFLDDRIAREAAWARQVTFQDQADPMAAFHARRQLLERHWRELIAATRGAYHGPLTYAANFDQYREVRFWGALDVIGINAYFPLREEVEPGLPGDRLTDRLREGWRRVFDEIEAFEATEEIDKPVVFTELGYIRRADCTVEPWNGDGFSVVGEDGSTELLVWKERPADLGERAAAVEALADVLAERRDGRLQGLLYWKLSTVESHVDVEPFVLVLNREDPLEAALRRVARGSAGESIARH